jgi:glucose-6-phosphate-specific signal transduction histidine kinase
MAVQQIYDRIAKRIYWFVLAVHIMICVTSLYVIRANRAIFDRLAALSDQRRELARKLIGVQEDILHSISRELHDEFGQILTAVGAMLGRAGSIFHPIQPHQVGGARIAQSTLGLAQYASAASLYLDDYGLEKALEWYVIIRKANRDHIRYEKQEVDRHRYGSDSCLSNPAGDLK